MTPLKMILLPTDFSECSNAALPLARSLARDHGAKLVLLHVAPIEVVPDGAYIVPMNPEVYRQALEELRTRVEGPDMKLGIDIELKQGDAAEEILASAAEHKADLIVIGTHGRSGLGRLILGSVAEAVMRRSTCPVLTVKPPTPEVSTKPSPKSPDSSVMVY
jgi:nucleotide-binding universal stress UspA family protein